MEKIKTLCSNSIWMNSLFKRLAGTMTKWKILNLLASLFRQLRWRKNIFIYYNILLYKLQNCSVWYKIHKDLQQRYLKEAVSLHSQQKERFKEYFLYFLVTQKSKKKSTIYMVLRELILNINKFKNLLINW